MAKKHPKLKKINNWEKYLQLTSQEVSFLLCEELLEIGK